ncbi:putative leucine-rich repeat-containing protein DDB_G0290503 [Melitaea cinxia]|uniref:putative leucine-rich repeat-containing protein DDB_G0290503 n=1 Tax=Melitaea cinxia TaxID=113334 RepID=UPI001E272014|nr:putative leucine-rich repeat-containing protein DDB_G0290503 [Melitaea cinxia]
MEGDGEGMVAVVRGTKHALTVTLISDNHGNPTRKCFDTSKKSTRVSLSSVETNTDRSLGNVNAPTCDIRCASSYRNIQFPDYESPYVSAIFPRPMSSIFRSQDLFTQSLRKYPSEKSSAELIQRIINYTRTKNYVKKRYSKSLRSLIRQSKSEIKARDETSATEEHPETDNQTCSAKWDKDLSQNELLNYTYDYLKGATLVPRHTDVQYFSEVKRVIRGRLRDIICDKPRASSVKDIEIQRKRNNTAAPRDAIRSTVVRHSASSNIVNCQSKINPCFCNRHPPVNDDEILNRNEPVQNLLSNLHPEQNLLDGGTSQTHLLDINGTEKETFENVINEWLKIIPVNYNLNAKDKLKREQLINTLIKTLKDLGQKYDFPELAKNEIVKCLDTLPMWHPDDSENDFKLKVQIADDLVKRLINVADENFKTAISEEVKKLPYDFNIVNDKFINRTIDKFIDKLTQVTLNRPLKDEEYKEKLRLEVISLLKDIPLQRDSQRSDQLLKLADKFVEHIYQYKIYHDKSKQTVADFESNEIEKKIYDWFENIPELLTHKYNKNQYSDLVKVFAKNLHKYNSKKSKDINFQRKLHDDVKEWLDRLTTRLNTKLTSERFGVLSKDLIEQIFGQAHASSIGGNLHEDPAVSKIFQYITEWYRNIPELTDYKDDMTEKIKELTFQLNGIQNDDNNFQNILADMRETIIHWLENILNAKGLELDSKIKDNLVNGLILKLTEEPVRENDGNKNIGLYKDVITWLKQVPFTKSYDFTEQNNLAGEFVVRLMDIEKTSNEDTLKNDVEEEIKKLISKLSTNDDKDVSPDEIEKLKLKVFTQMKITPLGRKLWNKRNNNLRKTLYENISKIIDSSLMLPEKLKPSLKHKITDVILKNIKNNTLDADKTISQISNIMKQDTSLTKNDIEILGKQIVEKVNNVLLRHESLHINPIAEELTKLKLSSKTNISQEKSSVETDMDDSRNRYERSSQSSKLYNQDTPSLHITSSKSSPLSHDRIYVMDKEFETKNAPEKLRGIKQKTVCTVQNNVTQTDDLKNHGSNYEIQNEYNSNSRNYSKNENSKIVENRSKDTSVINNLDKAAKLFDKKIEQRKSLNKSQITRANRSEQVDENIQTKTDKGINTSFLDEDFSTSMPITSSIKYPSVVLLSTTNNSFVTKTNNIEVETSDPLQYLNKIKELITNWLHHFPLNLNEHDKDELTNNIASDILDRQKYIQLSDGTTEEKKELEHLKYHIFKRIHKLDNHEVVRDIISNVDCLNHRILSLKTPNLIQPTQERKEEIIEINLPDTDNIQTNIDESSNKIGEWFENFFPNLIDNFDEDKIQILARNLENLKINNNYDSSHIKKEIFQWISGILNNIDVKKICDVAESLKKHLCNTNITDTFILRQDTSEFLTENLCGVIIEWIRTTQYRYKLQNEIQDYFAMVLANDIKHVFAQSLSDNELNEHLIQEILRDLAMVTGESSDSAFHHAVACDLLQFLKELQLFHDLSDRETINEFNENKVGISSKYLDDIKEAVVEWLNMLPLQESVPVRQIEDLITSLVDIIKDKILEDILNNESILKHHILRLLSKIPLRIDYQGLESQVASLVAKLKDILCDKQPETNKTTRDFKSQVNINREETPSAVYKQLLHNTVSKTLLDKITFEEQRSFNLMKEKLADAFIDLHYSTGDEDFRNEFKNKLYREISKFCDDYLKRRPVSPIDSNRLQEDLHNLLKNVSLSTTGPKTNTSRQEQEENQLQESDFLRNESIRENKTTATKNASTQSTPQISPTSLSLEDIEHLQKIRTRSEIQSKPENATNNLSLKYYEDVGIQTTVVVSNNIHKSVQTSNASMIENVPIHREISPKVLIREYYWDSSGSNQSFQILEPSKDLPPKEIAAKTKVTTKTQTEPTLNNEKQYLKQISKTQKVQESIGKEISFAKDTETQTEDLQQNAANKSRYVLQSKHLDDIPESQSITSEEQQNKISDTRLSLSKRRERTEESTDKIFEKETADHLESFNKDRRKFKAPKATTMSENLSPIIITEKRSERRVYASPEYITNDNRGSKVCCNCKNHLLTQCRNKPYTGCRQVSAKNTLRHCSKCFGGYCPHPSYFFSHSLAAVVVAMDGEGMVAVVRGLQGSGLAVTLLDSGRQFTLLPENYSHSVPRTNGDGRRCYATVSQCTSNVARRESGVQATDGRYTSTYKMMHCHYTPTSPPDEVTEFPPQRPEICPACKNRNASPSRNIESHVSNQTFCVGAESSRHTSLEKLKSGYQPEVVIRPKRCEESPTREIFRQNSAEVEAIESYRRPTFCKTNDVRYLRDVSRKVRESMRSLSPPVIFLDV